MKRGFFDGLLAGALLGVILGARYIPGTQGKLRRPLMKKGRIIGMKAGRILSETRDAIDEVKAMLQRRLRH
jgi:hypothetical protein